MIRITLVDDHRIIFDGLKAMLIGINDIEAVDYVSRGSEVFHSINKNRPDIIVLDIKLPDISGIDLAKQIIEKYPGMKIMILSAQEDEESILESIKAGVKCFLHKDTTKEEFIKAVRFVYDGFEYFGDSISKIVYKSYVNQVKSNDNRNKEEEKLTEREKEILILISKGLSFKDIAEKLFISVRTVETHKKNISEKMGFKSTADIIKYAIKNNFIEL